MNSTTEHRDCSDEHNASIRLIRLINEHMISRKIHLQDDTIAIIQIILTIFFSEGLGKNKTKK